MWAMKWMSWCIKTVLDLCLSSFGSGQHLYQRFPSSLLIDWRSRKCRLQTCINRQPKAAISWLGSGLILYYWLLPIKLKVNPRPARTVVVGAGHVTTQCRTWLSIKLIPILIQICTKTPNIPQYQAKQCDNRLYWFVLILRENN